MPVCADVVVLVLFGIGCRLKTGYFVPMCSLAKAAAGLKTGCFVLMCSLA